MGFHGMTVADDEQKEQKEQMKYHEKSFLLFEHHVVVDIALKWMHPWMVVQKDREGWQ